MNDYVEKYHISQRDISTHVDALAWNRSGFKDGEALKQAVRELSLEEKVEMLVEANLADLSEMLWNRKQEFLLNLGHKTWVDGDEAYEIAKRTYKDEQWEIDRAYFHPVCVFSGTHTSQMNTHVIDRLTEKRNKK